MHRGRVLRSFWTTLAFVVALSVGPVAQGDGGVSILSTGNDGLRAQGMDYLVQQIDFFQRDGVRSSDRFFQQEFRWVPDDPRRDADGAGLTYLFDTSWGEETADGIDRPAVEASFGRAVDTWAAAQCLDGVALTAIPHDGSDVTIFDWVVDAGGRGLTVVLAAFDTVLTGRRPLPRARELASHDLPEVALVEPRSSYSGPAFEVMYLLDADADRIPGVRAALEPLGDSLLIGGGEPQWSIHVHADDVGAAIEAGLAAGRPHQIRVTHLAGPSAPAPNTAGRSLVAFAAGDGLADLFESAGAVVVRAPVGYRPSTGEMLEAIRRRPVSEVVLLPNHRDGIPVAEAAAAEARSHGIRAAVIPTTAQVQGLSAAAVHEPGRVFDSDVVAMTAAAGHTRHGAVTVAAKEAVTSAGVCRPGDVLGVVEGDFAIIGDNLVGVALGVVQRMLPAGGDLLTLVTGAEADGGLADTVRAVVHAQHPEIDIVVYDGGQGRYPLLIGVE
ncbi:MAG: DAK2 domain-containing protein [Actinomycetota bacterium]